MKFWAIAYIWEEDVFYDIGNNEDTRSISESCFLPTKEIALEFIEELGSDYKPVEITLERLEANGVWSWSRGPVERWDEEE